MTNHLQEGFYEWWSCAKAVLMHTASKTITSCLKPVDSVHLQRHWKHLKASESIWRVCFPIFYHASPWSWKVASKASKVFLQASAIWLSAAVSWKAMYKAPRIATKPQPRGNSAFCVCSDTVCSRGSLAEVGTNSLHNVGELTHVCSVLYQIPQDVGDLWGSFKEAVEFSMVLTMFAHSLCQATAAPGLESFAPGSLEFQLQA